MKTIRFCEACLVKDYRVGTPEQESYDVGQIVSLADPSADRWLRRGKAVLVEPEPEPTPAPPAPVAESEAAVPHKSRALRERKKES